MAVQANAQQIQMKPVSSSGTVPTSNSLSLANSSLILTIPSVTTTSDVSKPVQLRVVQTTQAITTNKSNPSQPQIVRLIKTNNKTAIANANIISVKAPVASPAKGSQPTLLLPSGARVLHHPAGKLKVGDTITIPKSTLISEKVSKHSSGNQQTEVLSTPPRIIRVADSSSIQAASFVAKSSALPSPVALPPVTLSAESSTSLSQHSASAQLSTISPVWSQSPLRYKRPSAFSDTTQSSETKRRRTPNSEKGSKGLRHFAMLVCEKVKQKGTTTYNEVADELVAEYSDSHPNMTEQYDQKNIRRRVYDALNVLMAMNIIYKDKKDINWIGFPTNSAQELVSLQDEKKKMEQRIEQKTLQLRELILQQIAFKNLVQRNKQIQETHGSPPENSFIQLPFIIVNTNKRTVIDCSISNDKYEYMFNFDNTFEIHDDIEVLKRMGMAYGLESGTCDSKNLRAAQAFLPPALKPYLEELAGYRQLAVSDRDEVVSDYTVPGSSYQTINQTSLNQRCVRVHPQQDSDALELSSCFSMEQVLDPDDQEVAMVTDSNRVGSSSGGVVHGVTPSSRSSSSGLHSAMCSLTPMSSAGSESRDSTPFDSFEP